MKMSDRGIAALVAHEGIVPGPYLDSVGVWTYGVGHTAAAGEPDPVNMKRGMPADIDAGLREVFRVFRADLAKYEAAVDRAVKVPVEQHEFDALVSFHYNTGAIGRADLVKALNRGDRKAATAGFMNWLKPAAIKERREAEQLLFAKGVYPSTKANIWQVSTTGKVIWKPLRTLTADQVLAYLRPGEAPRPAPKLSTGPTPKPVPVVDTIAPEERDILHPAFFIVAFLVALALAFIFLR